MKRYPMLCVLLALAFVASLATGALAGNKKLMTVKMAKQDLKRNFVEYVTGYKVKSEGEFGLTEDAKYQVDTKAAAVIKGVIEDECIYDKEKDIAICYGHMDLDEAKNILGDYVRYKNVTLHAMGLGSMTESSRPALRALRAAMLNAYDELASKLVGEKILSRSTAENYLLTKDSNRSKVCAAVYGAHIPQQSVKFGKKGWGWDADGDAWVILQLDVERVRDLLGADLKYKGENIVEVMGQGTAKDDLSELRDQESGTESAPRGSKVKYGSIDVPVGPKASEGQEDFKGGAQTTQ